jgi:CheY-like chemotaxis protein
MPDAKILIIDDDGSTRILLAVELEKMGYSVFKADDGEVGLQVVRAAKPDLIICDVLMPNMNGNEFLKKLRDREYSRDIPVIILSARGQMKDYFMMMDVSDFISKPFQAEDIAMRIERALANKKQEIQARYTEKPKVDGEVGEVAPGEAVIRKKVILLDDDMVMFEKFQKILGENSFEVKQAKTVTECLDMAMRFLPDVIAMRYLTDGVGTERPISMIKEAPHVRNIPFVIYGNDIADHDKENILNDGADFFVNNATDAKILQALQKMVG